MKKDFEKAYRALAETEAPDLWDRIEAGLGEKSAPAIPESEKKQKNPAGQRKKGITVFMRKYSALAAAVVCAVILIPAMIVMKRAGGSFMSGSTKEQTAEDRYEAAADAAEEEMAPAEAEDTAEAVSEAAAGDAQETVEAEVEAAKMTETERVADAAKELTEAVEESKKESAMSDEAASADAALTDYDAQNAEELKNTVVKVKRMEGRYLQNNLEEMGTLYTAEIEKDPSGALQEGEEIQIFIPVVSSIALSEDGTFELDLAPSEKEDNVYTVTAYHREVKE